MLGDIIAGKYRLIRRIGEGGMGVVYEAEHVAMGRRVALKILSKELVTEDVSQSHLSGSLHDRREEIVARFAREARSTGAIEAENVVRVFDAGTDESGRPYMAMEMLDGSDLQKLCKRLGPLPPELCLRIAAQACVGLGKAHDAGIIHRDVTMANIFLTNREAGWIVVKILDFGIAKVKLDKFQAAREDGLTRTGAMLGSPHYMSPEQAQGLRTIDHRTDIWSLGIVLYKALTRRSPFTGESVGQLILEICSTEPTPIQDLAPWVSPGVAAIVHRALQRAPAARFSSATEMLAAIKAEMSGKGSEIHKDMLVALSGEEKIKVAPRRTTAPSPGANVATTLVTPPSAVHTGALGFDAPITGTQAGLTSPSPKKRRSLSLSLGILGVLAAGLGWGFVELRARAAATATPLAAAVASAETDAVAAGSPVGGPSSAPAVSASLTPAVPAPPEDTAPKPPAALASSAPARAALSPRAPLPKPTPVQKTAASPITTSPPTNPPRPPATTATKPQGVGVREGFE